MEATDDPNPVSAGWTYIGPVETERVEEEEGGVGKGGAAKKGECTIFSNVTGKTKAKKDTVSAHSAKRTIKLWPSW